MDRFTLLPSVNWNISHMLVVNEDGTTYAYGSKGDIIIVKNIHLDDIKEYETKFIPKAHKNHRVMGLSFVKVELEDEIVESLVSCGDDGRIKIWNIETGTITHKCLFKKNSNTGMKLVDVDVFPQNNCIVAASENGSILKWHVDANKVWIYNIDPKIIVNCVAVCPHVEDLIAIGAQFGLVFIYSLKGEGKLRHRIRCHDNAVFSVSWCPVPYNALQLSKLREDANFDEEEWKKKDKTLLLASCSRDRSVYICKAGTNGYCEAVLTLPAKPVTNVPRHGIVPNTDRGRYLRWIYPSVLLTFTDFNEMIAVYMFSKNEQKSDPRQKAKLSSVKFEVKPLHNVHKRNISNFAVHLNKLEEVDFRVWSCSSDRLLVRSGYRVNYKEKTVTLPLLSGKIFCLDISPLNPDLLAIGTGDGKICRWNLSTDSCIDISTLSKKIDSKVMSIRWHPLYEGVLAFGTCEGRVGMFDLSQGRTTPTLFKLFHNKTIYKLCWAFPPTSDLAARATEMHLFAVGNGDILQFNPSNLNEMPVSLNEEALVSIEEACKCKNKTDLCYDQDQKLVAIGLTNGNVCICSAESFKLHHTIVEPSKAIMSLAWHPKIVYECPTETSTCSNWLAIAGEHVLVYSVDPNHTESPKKIASLEVHSSRVLCVSWSPHINGRLLTCSGDNTAIIWDVLNQTIIGRYSEHYDQVFCGVWNPVNKDVVITGSADFTCRMWSVSKDTINKINDSKKKRDKIIEPTILNASSLNDSSTIDTPSISFAKNSKAQTLLPSVNLDFPHGLLLEKVFTNAINKLKSESTNESPVLEKCDEDQVSEKSIHCNGLKNEIETEIKSNHLKDESEEKNLDCNYAQVFGTDDELRKLVLHEEKTLECTGKTSECLILNQARYDLGNKIKEAVNKNQVTEELLALAPSVSPKLWKEACQVYIEQMIKTDNIFQAVNYQLALGKDDEAIELLCEKNRFKEALVLARLRTTAEVVTNVLEKWISYCYNCGLYRLGAHCHMFLKNEENACTLLNKSKLLKDMILTARLLKFYQPTRAKDLAIECFKKHLSQLSATDVQILFDEFPEIKFLQPWYSAFKYFKEKTPNTADVTKWILGMLAENSLAIPTADVNYDKLRVSIVDNTFNMNYEQLMTYVSALAALYISGISSPDYKASALRNYIRGLSHCYNYKLINGHRILSDAAYPMMRLLKLMFPEGLFQDSTNSDLEANEITKKLYKSIKAYYCDFLFTWLVQCEDLPKSLKTVIDKNEELGDGDEMTESEIQVKALEPYTDRFPVIRDKKTKLRKIVELLTLYIDDILDSRTVSYFRESFLLKKLENSAMKTSSPERSESADIVVCSRPSLGGAEIKKPLKSTDELGVGELNLSINGLSLDQSNISEVFGDDVGNDKQNKADTNEAAKIGKPNEDDLTQMKMLKDLIDEFGKERVSAPNPTYFLCIAKEYVEKSKEIDDELSAKLQELITKSALKCGIH